MIVARDVQLAKLTNSRLHVCHVSTAESIEIIRWAKKQGIKVTAEATPHHLLLDYHNLSNYDTTFKVNPPLRSSEHIEALREALVDGTVDFVATDHAPHAVEDKDHDFTEARPGMIGLEQALAVVMELFVKTGRLDWEAVAERMSYGPAKFAGLMGQGLPLTAGNPANVVLVDPTARKPVERDDSASLARNNPYHGLELPDPIVATFWAGKMTYSK